VSVLAALGTERALAGPPSRRFVVAWLGGAAIVAMLATVGVLTALAQSISAGFGGGRDELISIGKGALIVGAWRSFLFIALLAGALLLAERRRLDRRLLAWGMAAIVALDLWSVDRLYWLFSSPASVLYGSDAVTDYLRKAPLGRVVVAPLSPYEGVVDRDPNYWGDGPMVHGIRLAKGYHGNEIGRYQQLASGQQLADYANLANPGFWRLANIRYLYVNVPLDQPGMTKLLGPVKNSAGSTVYLYRLPGDNPPAWVAPVMVKAGDEATAGTILDPRFDPLRIAVIDSASPLVALPVTALPQRLAITPTVTRYDPGHLGFQLSAPAPAKSILVVSENYFPGWRATVDGTPAQAVRTDYNLIGVPLPAGASKVSLDFMDPAYQTGKAVTLMALLLAFALVAGGALAERRRRAL
jgi:hypothetical protein